MQKKTNLSKLDIGFNNIGNTGLAAFGDSTSIVELSAADRGENGITEQGILGLAKNRSLQILYIRFKNSEGKGIKALLENPELSLLDIWGQKITDEDIKAISENTTLNEVSPFAYDDELHRLTLGDSQATLLASNTHLNKLDLTGNRIRNAGAIALAKNKTFKTLYVGGNKIAQEGVQALSSNATLIHLDVFMNIPDKMQRFTRKHEKSTSSAPLLFMKQRHEKRKVILLLNKKKAVFKN